MSPANEICINSCDIALPFPASSDAMSAPPRVPTSPAEGLERGLMRASISRIDRLLSEEGLVSF